MSVRACVVVPCFNEGERWNAAYWTELLGLDGFRWLFVNDGSHDSTAELAAHACDGTSSSVLSLPRNVGKAEAVRVGLLDALSKSPEAPAVGFMDADGAFAIQDIERILGLFETMKTSTASVDAVWSSRVALSGREVRRSPRRHYFGRLAATLISWNNLDMPYDTQSGFKLFDPSAEFINVLDTPFDTRWLFEVEMLGRFREVTGRPMKVWEEPLYYWQDVPGSKVSPREVVRIGSEILRVRRLTR